MDGRRRRRRHAVSLPRAKRVVSDATKGLRRNERLRTTRRACDEIMGLPERKAKTMNRNRGVRAAGAATSTRAATNTRAATSTRALTNTRAVTNTLVAANTRATANGFIPAVLLLVAMAALSGCMEYTLDTTLNPDGSGVREELMEAVEQEELDISSGEFRSIMHVGEDRGWSHEVEVDQSGDTHHLFRRVIPVTNLASWSGLNDEVRIDGAPASRTDSVGYVSFGDIRFRNRVDVRRAADSDGNTTFTYRERFRWEKAADALVEFFMTDLEERLTQRYPDLPPQDRGEIVGFARAHFWTAVDQGLFGDGAEEDRLLARIVDRTAEKGIEIVRVRYPREDVGDFRDVLTPSLMENDEALITFLEEELKGLAVALNSEIVFRLSMPGRVTDSNAHKREGTTLVWEFGPMDAVHTPVEIYAESVMGG